MKIDPQEFDRMRHWFALVSEKVFPPQLMTKAQPLAHLDELAERSPARAREGLGMAIGDLIELTATWPDQDVQSFDAELREQDLPTLTAMRARFSKAVARAVRRGRINDEAEYRAIRNAAELAEPHGALWSLIAAYEESQAR